MAWNELEPGPTIDLIINTTFGMKENEKIEISVKK